MLITNYDVRKIFIGGNRYITATYTNSTGSEVPLFPGRIMGRVFASNKVLPHVSNATDGSQFPLGILRSSHIVANGATVTVTICVGGDVARDLVILGGSDTLPTVVSTTYTDSGSATVAVQAGTIEDLLRRNANIYLKEGTELTGTDNQ